MTTDGGGWTLLATLQTTTSFTTVPWGQWRPDWWNVQNGTPSDPKVAFSNHDTRLFKTLINPSTILRATNNNNHVKRYHFGFSPNDWDLWNNMRSINNVRLVGPFNLAHVMVSTLIDLSGAVVARSNGHWDQGVFYLGTIPGGADTDGEGLGARFHVGSNASGQYGYVGDVRANAIMHLWLRETPVAGRTCSEIRAQGHTQNGIYLIDPDGPGPVEPFRVYCDMTMASSGWTLIESINRDHPLNANGTGLWTQNHPINTTTPITNGNFRLSLAQIQALQAVSVELAATTNQNGLSLDYWISKDARDKMFLVGNDTGSINYKRILYDTLNFKGQLYHNTIFQTWMHPTPNGWSTGGHYTIDDNSLGCHSCDYWGYNAVRDPQFSGHINANSTTHYWFRGTR